MRSAAKTGFNPSFEDTQATMVFTTKFHVSIYILAVICHLLHVSEVSDIN